MSLRSRTIAVALAAVAVAGPGRVPVANAQQKTVEITPFVGYYIAADIYNSYSSATSYSSVGLTNSFIWGGRLTASNPRGGIEFAYTRTGSDVSINNTLAGQPRRDIGRVDIDNYDINFLAYQPSGNPRVTPFGEIGLGWASVHPNIDSDFIKPGTQAPSGNTLFNFNFGLGTKVAMSPKISLRLEGRWRVMDTNYNTNGGVWCDPWGYCYSYASSWYNSGELIGGLSYTLR